MNTFIAIFLLTISLELEILAKAIDNDNIEQNYIRRIPTPPSWVPAFDKISNSHPASTMDRNYKPTVPTRASPPYFEHNLRPTPSGIPFIIENATYPVKNSEYVPNEPLAHSPGDPITQYRLRPPNFFVNKPVKQSNVNEIKFGPQENALFQEDKQFRTTNNGMKIEATTNSIYYNLPTTFLDYGLTENIVSQGIYTNEIEKSTTFENFDVTSTNHGDDDTPSFSVLRIGNTQLIPENKQENFDDQFRIKTIAGASLSQTENYSDVDLTDTTNSDDSLTLTKMEK